MTESFRYDYGQTVRIVASAPASLRPGAEVAVVGMTKLDYARELLGVRHPVGTVAYLIEYADGTSVEVPEQYIEPA
jgi:hypothetical protein